MIGLVIPMQHILSAVTHIDCGNAAAVGTLPAHIQYQPGSGALHFPGNLRWLPPNGILPRPAEHMFLATQNNQLVWATPGPGNSGTSDTSKIKANTWTHAVITRLREVPYVFTPNQVLSSSVQMSAYTVNITSPVSFMIGRSRLPPDCLMANWWRENL